MTEQDTPGFVLPSPEVVASWTPEQRKSLRDELDAADGTTPPADPAGTIAADENAPPIENVGAVSNDGTNVVIGRPFGTAGIGLPVHEAINVAAWILHHAALVAGDVGLGSAEAELNALLAKVEELQSK